MGCRHARPSAAGPVLAAALIAPEQLHALRTNLVRVGLSIRDVEPVTGRQRLPGELAGLGFDTFFARSVLAMSAPYIAFELVSTMASYSSGSTDSPNHSSITLGARGSGRLSS
jgi:hypothetical protein